MKRHIVRHFPAKDLTFQQGDATITIPNDFRYLDLDKAEETAKRFRTKLQADGPHVVRLRGYSNALRTRLTLLLGTAGICDATPTVLIPELSLGSDTDSQIMIGGFKKNGVNVGAYSPEEIAACDRIGMRGAEAIKAKEKELGMTDGETLYFTHAPICSFFALHLAGNPEQARELVLKTPSNEGDRYVAEDGKLTLVPLAG